jgi:putative transposase
VLSVVPRERVGAGGARNKLESGKRPDYPARLIEGQRTTGWREALTELDTAYPGRIK